MSFHCTHCQANIEDAAIDRSRQIATCGSCGLIVDMQAQLNGSSSPRMRESVTLPAGVSIDDDGMTLVIKRRWLRGKHFIFLLVLGALSVDVAYQWIESGYSGWLLAGTIILGLADFRLLSMFVNATTIRAAEGRVEVTHGPMPSLVFKNQSLAATDIRQLFAAKLGAVYEVGALLNDGRRVPLVQPMISEEQAIFVEQRLEYRLGLVDFAVDGEVGSAKVAAGHPAAVSTGAGGLIAGLPLVLIGASLLLFFAMTTSSVEGSFAASGDRLGTFTFAPDTCRSGETRGFFGVELKAGDSATIVRAMRDPVRGTLIAIERGGSIIALTPEQCSGLNVQITQTSTSVNEVWAVEGSASADCDEFRGSVTFDGCH